MAHLSLPARHGTIAASGMESQPQARPASDAADGLTMSVAQMRLFGANAAQQAVAADRLIEYPIVADLGFAAFRGWVVSLRNPRAAYARTDISRDAGARRATTA